MTTVAVIDYGMGNLRSVCKAIEHVDDKMRVVLTSAAGAIRAADRVVFPGQGAIVGCQRALREKGLVDVLHETMASKPFLGICLGLQALYESSEEGGGTPGLGVLPGVVKRFAGSMQDGQGLPLKVPHMGWNQVYQTCEHPLWQGIDQDARFYFVHSYYVDSRDDKLVAGKTHYGIEFTSAAARENIFAVQFHPEKSQHAGLQLLANFVTWNGEP
ncbi:MAG: imidazole glycerol phosphate synthase subunit HisH [Gammaproteobacteria bacterium]|nr:MAG: imidazole glycerol phosphate synthase subunit HisH [Gammaproteobacteria bacterium]